MRPPGATTSNVHGFVSIYEDRGDATGNHRCVPPAAASSGKVDRRSTVAIYESIYKVLLRFFSTHEFSDPERQDKQCLACINNNTAKNVL